MERITFVSADQEVSAKRCKGCGKLYPLTTFGKHPRTADGRLGYCPSCMSEAHAKPFRELKRLAAEGKYVDTGYGGKHFQKHMQERVQAARPQKSVTLHLGHGIVEQPRHVPVEESAQTRSEQIAALNAVETPEMPMDVSEPAVTAPEPVETRMSLECWMTEPDTHPRGELFQVGVLLIRRFENSYTLYSLDGSAPSTEVPGDVLLWAVRATTQTPLDQDILGMRYY